MHAPVGDAHRHVTARSASMVLDCANAVYGLMLQCLARCFETPWSRGDVRSHLVGGCVGAMKALSVLGRSLTQMDAAASSQAKAGVSFAMPRGMQGWLREEDALAAIRARAGDIVDTMDSLDISEAAKSRVRSALGALAPADSSVSAANV
jgi:hypothetical protein